MLVVICGIEVLICRDVVSNIRNIHIVSKLLLIDKNYLLRCIMIIQALILKTKLIRWLSLITKHLSSLLIEKKISASFALIDLAVALLLTIVIEFLNLNILVGGQVLLLSIGWGLLSNPIVTLRLVILIINGRSID